MKPSPLEKTSHLNLSRSTGADLKATEQSIEAEAHKPVQHSCKERTTRLLLFIFTVDFIFEPRLTCRGENAPGDSAQPHQELPQRHVLFGDGHHQRAGIVLHKDARDTVTARRMVYHPLLEKTTGGTRLLGGVGSEMGPVEF